MNPDCHHSGPGPYWILDIDGTLMPSQQVDNQCYWQAVFEHFGEQPRTLDLHGFKHVTDGSILQEWMMENHGRLATPLEVADIRRRFLVLIAQARESVPQAFAASPGLLDWLDQQRADQGPRVAIATGGWSHTAEFKLRAAGLQAHRLPLASSDDGDSRPAIMQRALDRLLAANGLNPGAIERHQVCYVGDGVWDLSAARGLGWNFIGIAAGEQANRLRQAGAGQVFRNFAELAASNCQAATAGKHLRDAAH